MTIQAKATIEVDGQIVLKRFSHDADQAKYDAIIRNREHLLPWLPWAHFYKEFKEMPEFTESQIKCFDEGTAFGYDIFYEGKFAGSADYIHFSEADKSIEIGYWLDKDYTGKGIVTRAVAKMVEYAFAELGMHRVVIQAASKNKASCRVAERLDFVHEGTQRESQYLDGEYYDTEIYSKLVSD